MTEGPRIATAKRVCALCAAHAHTRRAPAFQPMRAASRSAFGRLRSTPPGVDVAAAAIDYRAPVLMDPVCEVCGTVCAHSHTGRNSGLLSLRRHRVRVCDEDARTRFPETRRKPGVCECAKCAPP
jgi:hypothetical protein